MNLINLFFGGKKKRRRTKRRKTRRRKGSGCDRPALKNKAEVKAYIDNIKKNLPKKAFGGIDKSTASYKAYSDCYPNIFPKGGRRTRRRRGSAIYQNQQACVDSCLKTDPSIKLDTPVGAKKLAKCMKNMCPNLVGGKRRRRRRKSRKKRKTKRRR